MGLNQKQKEAVEYLDGPLLVLAGPGTGKTQLLSEKVAYILKNTDTNPENILCLTFTETGASNMRERLKSIVGKDGLKVNIGTYHAFGQEILALYQNYSENYDRKLDNAIDEVLQFKIVKTLQSNLPATDILRKDNVKDIISTISDAKAAGYSPEDLAYIAKQNIEDSKVLSDVVSPFLLKIVPRKYQESLEAAYGPIHEVLKNYVNLQPICQNVERLIAGLARDLDAALDEAEASQKIKPLTSWKDKYFVKDERGNYRLDDRIANLKLASVAKLMKAYQLYLSEHGLFDFDDMIQEAVRVLKEDDGFRLSLQERFQFILLDEFQDTNPSQFMIVKQLTDYEKPMIMAVGDDDQAIYEFQGALSTNLTDFKDYYHANVVPLVENYRSTQEILDFSRQIINQATDRFADKKLIAHKEDPKKSQIYRHEFLSSDMEFGFIADEISRLIKSGVPQSEIAIIAYKRKYFTALLPFLKAHTDIKIAYEKRDNLLEDDAMHQIIAIARMVDEIAREEKPSVSLVEVLSYPFFELPVLEVVRAIGRARDEHKPAFDYLLSLDEPKIKETMEFLAVLAAKSFTEPLDVILDLIVGKMQINKFSSYDCFRFYENLASLRGKVSRHFGDRTLKLHDLVELVDDYESAEMTLNTTSPYRDADEAVQILTAHKAKGLEFRYVFIVSTDHAAWGRGGHNNNLLSLPKNMVHIRHTGMTDSEKLRILYVALTRAKDTLYLTNSVRDFNDKSPERLEYLEEYVEKTDDGERIVSPFLPAQEVTTHYEASASDFSGKIVENLRNWVTPYAASTPDMRALYLERMERFRMSATSLTDFIDIVFAGPEEFFKRYVLGVPSGPETESLAFGNLIHKTYEKITNDSISDEEAVQFFLEELEKRDLPSEVKVSLREKGPEYLNISLRAFGKILRSGKAEVNLGPEKIVIDGVPVTGKIDHITIDDDARTIEIYDFKTGTFYDKRWESHRTLFKYMLQLGFYKLLLNNSLKYRNYKVTRAHILFVAPDADGEVHDKIYEFNDEQQKYLLQTMKAVYEQVRTLKFMDDPELFRSPDGSLDIKDIKEFIDFLLRK